MRTTKGVIGIMDKQKIGNFIKEARKAKGMTQKELADQLYISSKAISKWETGTNVPNVDMLIPLSKLLDVSVSEILQGKKIEECTPIQKENVEELVQKAITLKKGEEENKTKKKQFFLLILAMVFSGVEIFVLSFRTGSWIDYLSLWIVAAVLGIYFTLFIKEVLPSYYDENKVNFYSDGMVRIHLFNISFNNRNWMMIISYIRYWSILCLVIAPFIEYCIFLFVPAFLRSIVVVFFFASLSPLYFLAKKYE